MSLQRRIALSALLIACGDPSSGSSGGDAPGASGVGAGVNVGGAALGGGGAAQGGAPLVPGACGNGVREAGEGCDQDDLGAAQCADYGMTGQLGCTPGCELDPTACVGCGNGFLDPEEQCDGELFAGDCLDGADPAWIAHVVELGVEPHAVIDVIRGAPGCDDQCQLTFESCGYCFDGAITGPETCEATDFGPSPTADFDGASCESLGFGPGEVHCFVCSITTEACAPPPPAPCNGGNCALRFVPSTGGIAELPWPPGLEQAPALTVEYWLRFQGGLVGPHFGLSAKSWCGDFCNGVELGAMAGLPDTMRWTGLAGGHIFNGTSPAVPAGAWHHLAGVFDAAGGSARLYVDGALADESALTPVDDSAALPPGTLALGQIDASSTFVWVDELRISSVARYDGDFTPQAVLAVDAETVALWHFDDDGSTLVDSGPQGLHGYVYPPVAEWTSEHP